MDELEREEGKSSRVCQDQAGGCSDAEVQVLLIDFRQSLEPA